MLRLLKTRGAGKLKLTAPLLRISSFCDCFSGFDLQLALAWSVFPVPALRPESHCPLDWNKLFEAKRRNVCARQNKVFIMIYLWMQLMLMFNKLTLRHRRWHCPSPDFPSRFALNSWFWKMSKKFGNLLTMISLSTQQGRMVNRHYHL